jgi:hypothetical protein
MASDSSTGPASKIGQPFHAVVHRNCIYRPVCAARCGSSLALSIDTVLTIALSDLLGRGVRLETHEAVALARELLANPYGIPTPGNIRLGVDGSASCINTDGQPSVRSFVDLLVTLLPTGAASVPAPLRYTLARGLEVVEAPQFKSLDEFTRVLARFEKGSARDVLKAVIERGTRLSPPIAHPAAVAPGPLTPPAGSPPPVVPRTAAVSPRPRLVVHNAQAAASEPRLPITAAPAMFGSFNAGGEAGSPARASRRWALPAAVALVVSFGVGFAVATAIVRRDIPTTTSGATTMSVGGAAAAPVPIGAAANPPEIDVAPDVEVKEEFVRVPQHAAAVREISPSSAKARAGAAPDRSLAPFEPGDAHGGAVHAAGTATADTLSPAFESEGTAVFFRTGAEADAPAREVGTAGTPAGGDLGVMTIVGDGAHNYHAQPSPDGRLVAFDSDRDGERGIYVANRDGSQVRRISGAGSAAVPTWSRSGEWLAYIRAEAGDSSVWNVWVQRAAGGNARRLTNYQSGSTSAASWFPDDRRIAYSHEDTLIVMDFQTGETTRYQAPVTGGTLRTPAVSPDGTRIIFQVFRRGAWLLHLADGARQRVLTDPTVEEFAWAPDGSRFAFHSRRDGQWGIYVLWRG